MLMKKGLFTRIVAGVMSLVMIFTIMPYAGTPALAADTGSSTTYDADNPDWIEIEEGFEDQFSLNMLAAFLRYQKGEPEKNAEKECSTYIMSNDGWDNRFVDDTMYIRLKSDITFKTKYDYTTSYDGTNNEGVNTMWYQTGGWTHNFPVYGNKVLDLNGHKIKIELTGEQVGAPLFKIMYGANLTIVDSKGGGKMIANSDLVDEYFDLFWVYRGGELVLNAPGAEFKSGYSKEEWLMSAYKQNRKPDQSDNDYGYNGYGRKLANGTAVTVRGGGKLTLAGGTVEGRGFSQISKYGYSDYGYGNSDYKAPIRCAAIKALASSTVHIIDGNVYGMGCADAMQINKSADITIEAGVFDVKKVDRVILPNADREGNMTGAEVIGATVAGMLGSLVSLFSSEEQENYMDGSYGMLGIPDSVFTALGSDKGQAVEVLCGDKKVAGTGVRGIYGYDRDWADNNGESVTIRPKSGKSTMDDRVSITPTSGMYSWTTDADDSEGLKVDVSIDKRYFSDRANELSKRYYRERKGNVYGLKDSDREYYLNYKFTLYDNDGDKVAYLGELRMPASSTSISGVNLARLYDYSGSGDSPEYPLEKWKKLSKGWYTVRCEVTEIWKGEHTYKTAWHNYLELNIRDDKHGVLNNLVEANFSPVIEVSHGRNSSYTGENKDVPIIGVSLTSETYQALYDAYKENYTYPNGQLAIPGNAKYTDVMVEYKVWDYDPDGNTLVDSSGIYSIDRSQGLWCPTPGLKVITAELCIPRYKMWQGTEAEPLIEGYDYIEVSRNFLLLPKMTIMDGNNRPDMDMPFATLQDGQIALMRPLNAISDDLKDKGSLSWQWYFFPEMHDWYDSEGYVGFTHLDSDEDGYVKIQNDGTYRLKCTYKPTQDGKPTQVFDSVPIDITSNNTERLTATLAISKTEPITVNQLGDTTLTLSCSNYWDEIETVQFSMKGRPNSVAYSKPIQLEGNGDHEYTIKLSEFAGIADELAKLEKDETGDPSGEYTFRAFVIGKEEKVYSKYRIYSNDVTLTVAKAAEGYSLTANGKILGLGGKGQQVADAAIPLYLDSNSRNVTFSTQYYPDNATYDSKFVGKSNIHYQWEVVSGDSISLASPQAESSSSTMKATINKPGTSLIRVAKYAGGINDDNNGKTITYFKVCVPVTEIEFTQPDYQSKIGQYYRDVQPTVVAKATCGVSLTGTDAFDFSYVEDGAKYSPVYRENGTSSNNDKIVAANDKGDIVYKFHLKDGQSYPLKQYDEDTYVVDTSAVKMSIKQSDGSSVTKTAKDWEVYYNVDSESCSLGTSAPSPNQAYFKLAQDVFVKDASATYIDVVTIATTEPGVGDPINEKITVYTDGGYERYPQPLYGQYKAANVFSLSGVQVADSGNANLNRAIIMPYQSEVSKASADTAGAPYTDADGAKPESGKSSGNDAILNGVYENGTYYNTLQLVTNKNTTADGTKYYFSPDCTVILNGHLLDFGDRTMYNSGYSTLSFSYFYDVGDVNTVNYLSLAGIKPLQGNTPADCEDVTATGYAFENGAANEAQVYLKQLTWFVDKDGNGEYDDGEEVKVEWTYITDEDGTKQISGYDAANSNLWWDGTFLPGVQYSALVEIGTDDSATRLAEAVEVSCDGKGVSLTGGQKTFVVTFDADKTIRTIHIATASGAAAANPANRDPLGVFNASNQGYKVSRFDIYANDPVYDDVSVNNVDIGKFQINKKLNDQTLAVGKYWMVMTFEPNSGYTVADTVKVLVNGSAEGEFGYGLEQVKDIYVAAQTSYVNAWRTFEVTEGNTDEDDDILLGDVNGDGEVTAEDLVMLAQHVAKIIQITDSRSLSCADVTKGDAIDANDLVMLAQYVAKIISSFD